MSILPEYINKCCKALIQQKKWICNSSTTISTASLNNNYFKIFTAMLLISHLKIARFTWHNKSFLKNLLRHGKDENKKGNVSLL